MFVSGLEFIIFLGIIAALYNYMTRDSQPYIEERGDNADLETALKAYEEAQLAKKSKKPKAKKRLKKQVKADKVPSKAKKAPKKKK